MPYLPPNVYIRREQSGNVSPLQLSRTIVPCLIGVTNGKSVSIANEGVTKSAISDYDALANEHVQSISGVGDTENITNYVNGTDYELSNSGSVGSVHWLDNPIDAPTLRTPTAESGGSIPAGTYDYTVTATQTGGLETTQSAAQSVTLTDSTSSVVLVWDGLDYFASGYKIYRDDQLIGTVVGSGINTFTDTGYAGGAAAPVANTTARKPADGATYYVSYVYKSYSFLTPTLYNKINTLQEDHGIDSDIGVAGKLVMGLNGDGQESPQCWVVSLDSTSVTDDLVGAYDAAIATLYRIDQFICVVPLTSNEIVHQKLTNHCQYMSSERMGKERFCAVGPAEGTTYTQVINNINTLNYSEYVRYIANDSCSLKVYSDVSTYAWTTYDGYMLAACYAGARAARTVPIDPLTNKNLKGDIRLNDSGGVDIYSMIEKDAIGAVGGIIFEYGTAPLSSQSLGIIRCRHDLTLAVNNEEYKHSSIWETDVYLNRAIKADLIAAGIIGNPDSNELRDKATRVILKRLAVEMAAGLISTIQDVAVEVDPERPNTGWIIIFNYRARYPVDTIILKRRFDFSIASLT